MSYIVVGNVSAAEFNAQLSKYNISRLRFLDSIGRYALEEYCETCGIIMNIVGADTPYAVLLNNAAALIVCAKSRKDLPQFTSLITTADIAHIPCHVHIN